LFFFLVLEARTGRYLGWRHVAQTYIIAPVAANTVVSRKTVVGPGTSDIEEVVGR